MVKEKINLRCEEKIEKCFSLLLWSFKVFLFYGDAECGNFCCDDDSIFWIGFV